LYQVVSVRVRYVSQISLTVQVILLIVITSHILKGLFIITDIAQNIFETDFCAAKAIASHQTHAHVINAHILYHKFQTIVIQPNIHKNTTTILLTIGKTCFASVHIFELFSNHLNTVFTNEFTRIKTVTINDTLNN
jgi:hypothetical protein